MGNILSNKLNLTFEKLNKTVLLIMDSILSFTPTPNFLSDIAAFEAVLIAIAIPLSFEIVSRISERYQSEVITKTFIQEWEIKWLPKFLVLNITLAIVLRFFVDSNPSSSIWLFFAWVTFIFFLFIVGVLLKFTAKLKHYMTDTGYVLNKLYEEAERFIKK